MGGQGGEPCLWQQGRCRQPDHYRHHVDSILDGTTVGLAVQSVGLIVQSVGLIVQSVGPIVQSVGLILSIQSVGLDVL